MIGPGFGLTWTSDLIGPIPNDWVYSIAVRNDPEQLTADFEFLRPSSGAHTISATVGDRVTMPLSSQTQNTLQRGATVHVRAELRSSTGVVEDSGDATATWNPVDAEWLLLRNVSTTQGLTGAQAQLLADNHAAINPPLLAHDGTPITGAVGDLIVAPSLKFLGIDTSTHVLTGSGVLEVPNIAGVQTAWGLVLDVAEAAPGASVKFGYVDSYIRRVAQFLLLWPARNTEEAMVIEELRLHLAHFTWLWKVPFTISVAYWIEPMFTVNARFVSAFFP